MELEGKMRAFLLISAAVVLASCKPSIKSFTISSAAEGAPVTFQTSIEPNYCSISQPTVMAKRLNPNPTVFGGPQNLNRSGTGYSYSASVPGYTFGQYEGLLSVPYRSSGSSGTLSQSGRFYVDAPQYIFHFDRGEKAAGWTFSGVYDSGTLQQLSTCDLSGYPAWSATVNWPTPDDPVDTQNGHGSLFIFIHPPCFPANPAASTTKEWKYTLRSPSISDSADWQRMKGVKAYFMSNLPGINVQPLVRVLKKSGGETFYMPIDSQNKPVFIDISQTGQWMEVAYAIPQAALANVKTFLFIQLNVFGDIATINGPSGGAEGANNIDFVCPIL
jgi:hypothetical protein